MKSVLQVWNRTRLVPVLLTTALLSGCRTSPPPETEFTTVVVAEEPEIAPPAPLRIEPGPVQASPLPLPSANGDWIALENWGAHYGLGKPVQIASDPVPRYALRHANTELAIEVGSRLAYWNGLTCWLGFAPQLLKGLPYVHPLDASKNLLPLLLLAQQPLRPAQTIVIDPGHGGRDPGTASCLTNRYEKHYTLDWALRLEKLLRARGWKVFLTRTNDRRLSLGDRVLLAERVQADLFLSLHFNSAGPNQEMAGIETYCLTPTGMPSSLLRVGEDDVSQTWPNNAFDRDNLLLALRLHRWLIRQTGAVDRGVRRARFMSVLREQRRPAVLIEGGYLSNPEEAAKIHSAAYRQRLALAVAAGLQ